MRQVTHGSADQSVYLQFLDAAGLPLDPAPTSASGGIDVWYRRQGGLKVSLSLADLSAVNDAHSDGGMIHIAGGVVRVDFPDAAFSSGASEVLFGGAIDGGVVVKESIGLIGFDNQATYVPSLASNMRGTDGAYTGTPDNAATIAAAVEAGLASEFANLAAPEDAPTHDLVKAWATDNKWVYRLSDTDLPDPTATGLVRVMDESGWTVGLYTRTAYQAAYNTGADGIRAMVQLDTSPAAGGTTGGRLRVLTPTPANPLGLIVFDGNSLTAGTGSYIEFVRQSLVMGGFDGRWDWSNAAVGAQTTQDMSSDAAATLDVLVDDLAYPRGNILVAWEITNDLYFGATADEAFDNFKAYCQARQAAGWRVIALDVLPRSDVGAPATFEADRLTVNARLLSEWPDFADSFVPVSTLAKLQDETDATYYAGDNVHLTTAGHAVVAGQIWPAVARLGGQPVATKGGITDAVVAEIGPSLGPGEVEYIETVLVDGDPLAGVDVWITTGADPYENIVAGTVVTNAQGEAKFGLDPETKYYVHAQKSGYTFAGLPKEITTGAA